MKIEGLILAAGLSSRAPGFKMTLPFEGKTILDAVIRNMLLSCSRIVVVGGYCYEKLIPICEAYEAVELVVNEHYTDGMFSSLKCGMKALDCDRFFMTPGDYPNIDVTVYNKLLAIQDDAVIPSFKGHAGHPILLSGHCIEACLSNNCYQTMRDFIKTLEVTYVAVDDEGVLLDVDTLADYQKAKRRRCHAYNR